MVKMESGGEIQMKPKIEHPKVFISYAWGSQEHDDKVIALATSLKGDGVGVVFDKWQEIVYQMVKEIKTDR